MNYNIKRNTFFFLSFLALVSGKFDAVVVLTGLVAEASLALVISKLAFDLERAPVDEDIHSFVLATCP